MDKQRQSVKAVFKAQREAAGDWCVIDASSQKSVANGLEMREAEELSKRLNAAPKQSPRVIAV